MKNGEPKVSWQMLAILAGVFIYTGFAAIQLGSIQQQVVSTSKEIGEAKLATATLAAQAVLQQQTLAEANTGLRERVARLEEQIDHRRDK